MNDFDVDMDMINSLKNILQCYLEGCQWNFYDEIVIAIDKAIDK